MASIRAPPKPKKKKRIQDDDDDDDIDYIEAQRQEILSRPSFTSGWDMVERAHDEDVEGNIDQAYALYKTGLHIAKAHLKSIEDKQSREAFTSALINHAQRAKEIKGELETRKKRLEEERRIAEEAALSARLAVIKPFKGAAASASAASVLTEDEKEKERIEATMASTVISEKCNVPWSAIVGLASVKEVLREAAILPFKFPSHFKGQRKAWTSILLYGAPGTGKSMLAKAVATEIKGDMYVITAGDIMNKFIGESEQKIRALFAMARTKKQCVIFMDEIDSIAGNRSDGDSDVSRRIKTELLTEMQGARGNMDGIVVIGATNTPWDLDTAILRRFNKRICIPLPEHEARKAMLETQLTSASAEDFASRTEGYSCSDLDNLFKDANYIPLRKATRATHFRQVRYRSKDGKNILVRWTPCDPDDENAVEKTLDSLTDDKLLLPKLTIEDYEDALTRIRPSVRNEDLKRYEEWTRKYGEDG